MRFLEIGHDGIAFHQPAPDHPFSTGADVPPVAVLFCDCDGVGVICHHVYQDGRTVTVEGPTIREEATAVFTAAHADCALPLRRQVFVNVTARKDARLDTTGKTRLRYDEVKDTFTVEAVPVKRVSKTALLTLLGPELVAAWFKSDDPVLVYGRELFKADTSVDLDSDAIAQVIAQAAQLGLLKPEQAQSISAALAVK
jgi:hypothetical protein